MSNKQFMALVEEVAKATPNGAKNLFEIYEKELTSTERVVINWLVIKKEGLI